MRVYSSQPQKLAKKRFKNQSLTRHKLSNSTLKFYERKKRSQRTLITVLTKKLAETLTDYLNDKAKLVALTKNPHVPLPQVAYLHSDIETLERSDILADLRSGKYDVVVGINLLREGLDLPEVSLVIIVDADKEGFLRSTTSLIQTIGRAQ